MKKGAYSLIAIARARPKNAGSGKNNFTKKVKPRLTVIALEQGAAGWKSRATNPQPQLAPCLFCKRKKAIQYRTG
jgi:hypothetical protein